MNESFVERYSIGDRIVVMDTLDYLNLAGREGTVVDIINGTMIGIEFDEAFPGGHDCGGVGRDGYCRWCHDISEIHHVAVEYYKEIEPDIDEITVLNTFLSGFTKCGG